MISRFTFNSDLLNCKQMNSANFNITNLVNFKSKMHLISEIVRWKQLSIRKSFCKALNKGQVRGSGKKPFAQKGRGKARQGSLKNPHQKGGGVAFPPHNQSYVYKMNKKKKHIALKSMLFSRFKYKKIFILDEIVLKKPSTKSITELLKHFNLSKVLIIDFPNIHLQLSVQNITDVKFLNVKSLNTIEILKKSYILTTAKAFDIILSFFQN